MNKKAQGLPITTIVLMVIILVTLVALALFFFSGFGRTSKQVDPGIAIAQCQSRCNRAKALAPYETDINNVKTKSGFCEDYDCNEYVECNVMLKEGNEAQLLKCP
ncbi:MAG TPA: hypothetical protein ENN30_02260 [Candidatus Woesearchaeota archaeon]|nr:hypothetical protein [Candidatus Woesearchaeota archaeon]